MSLKSGPTAEARQAAAKAAGKEPQRDPSLPPLPEKPGYIPERWLGEDATEKQTKFAQSLMDKSVRQVDAAHEAAEVVYQNQHLSPAELSAKISKDEYKRIMTKMSDVRGMLAFGVRDIQIKAGGPRGIGPKGQEAFCRQVLPTVAKWGRNVSFPSMKKSTVSTAIDSLGRDYRLFDFWGRAHGLYDKPAGAPDVTPAMKTERYADLLNRAVGQRIFRVKTEGSETWIESD